MKLSHSLAILLWVSFAALVLVLFVFPPSWSQTMVLVVLGNVVIVGLTFGWFLADSKENGITTSKLLKFSVVFFAAIALPYYRSRYFGTKAGLVFTGLVAAILIGIFSLVFAVDSFIHGGGAS